MGAFRSGIQISVRIRYEAGKLTCVFAVGGYFASRPFFSAREADGVEIFSTAVVCFPCLQQFRYSTVIIRIYQTFIESLHLFYISYRWRYVCD